MKKSIVGIFGISAFALISLSAAAGISPPVLIPDSTLNDINHTIEVTFEKDSAWVENINEIWINGREVHFSFYKVSEDKIELLPDVFFSPGANSIIVKSEGFNDAELAQELNEGGVWDNSIISYTPADNSFKIGKDTALVLKFEKNVTLQEGSIKIFKIEYATDDGLYETISSFSENVTGDGTSQITINSTKDFTLGSYYIMIDDNVFGENFKGFNHTFDWSFTTSYMLDELVPGVSLGHDVRLTISLPESFSGNSIGSYPGMFVLDSPWTKGLHTDMHRYIEKELIPADPVVITIGPPYEKDIIEIRELDYTRNYDKFYNYLKSDLVPYATKNFKIDPASRIMAGGSYAGFMTLYSFFQSAIQRDSTFYSFIPSSPVMAGYFSMMDQLSESPDSIGKNLIYFVAEFDLATCLSVHPVLNNWVKDNTFSYFNYYDEIHLGKDHYNTTYDAIKFGTEIILNLPKPYFAFKKYHFIEDDTIRYNMIRRWPKSGILSGNGVSDSCFIPSLAGAGVHTITYTFTDENNQTFSRDREITVEEVVGMVPDLVNNANQLTVYPNPTTRMAYIQFDLEETMPVRLSVFNLVGQEQILLLSEDRPVGEHEVQFDATQLKTGVYIVRLVSDRISTCKLIVQ